MLKLQGDRLSLTLYIGTPSLVSTREVTFVQLQNGDSGFSTHCSMQLYQSSSPGIPSKAGDMGKKGTAGLIL